MLRLATQRHVGIFTKLIPANLTPPQFSALITLYQNGPCSQNELGRRIATDGATIKGIVNRLTKRGLMQTTPDPNDGRMLIVSLSAAGTALAASCIGIGLEITEATLAPFTQAERRQFLAMLKKLG
ncbi:MAG: MarR family transcriptional regulator [Acidocella sp.]|nr:MarR family transcriptional regulator [Acidocella sp.]